MSCHLLHAGHTLYKNFRYLFHCEGASMEKIASVFAWFITAHYGIKMQECQTTRLENVMAV